MCISPGLFKVWGFFVMESFASKFKSQNAKQTLTRRSASMKSKNREWEINYKRTSLRR